jgi:hypothetical protein
MLRSEARAFEWIDDADAWMGTLRLRGVALGAARILITLGRSLRSPALS